MGAQQKEGAKLRGGGELLRSPVVPLYLSPIIQFTHRVINKVAIIVFLSVSLVSLLLKKVMGHLFEGGDCLILGAY